MDTTRIAGSDGSLWAQIFDDNREQVLAALGGVEELLAAFRAAIENRDTAELTRLWEAGAKRRAAINKKKK